jgi:hypothetical protein
MRWCRAMLPIILFLAACDGPRPTAEGPGGPSAVRPTATAPGRVPSPATRAAPSPAPSSDGAIVALLADNRLVVLRAEDGATLASHAFAAPPGSPLPGQFLALGRDRRTVYALILGTPDRLVTLDVATLTVRAAHALAAEAHFNSLRVGPVSGRLYLFDGHPGGVMVQVLDPATGATVARWDLALGGNDWHVLQAEITPDEGAFYLSYHGADTTGIDRFAITGAGVERCAGQPRPNVGCIAAHGPFALDGTSIVSQRGDTTIVTATNPLGRPQREYDTGLLGNHMVELAVDAPARRLYALGSYGYRPGFAARDLDTGVAPVPAEPSPPSPLLPFPCGERLALAPGPWAAIARVEAVVPDAKLPGTILIVDTRLGEAIRTLPTPAEPCDVLIVTETGAAWPSP